MTDREKVAVVDEAKAWLRDCDGGEQDMDADNLFNLISDLTEIAEEKMWRLPASWELALVIFCAAGSFWLGMVSR